MDDDTKLVLIDNSAMALFETRADELIISGNKEELTSFVKAIDQNTFTFDDYFLEARYFYTLANCYSDVYRYRDSDWYSEDLSKAVVNFRKALYAIKFIESLNVIQSDLKSRIETNLANYLSSQGRAIYALEHWDIMLLRLTITLLPLSQKLIMHFLLLNAYMTSLILITTALKRIS
jgi:hypothetical protein